jgi:hypothetical protein
MPEMTHGVPKDERRWVAAIVWLLSPLLLVGATAIVLQQVGMPLGAAGQISIVAFALVRGVRNLKKRTYVISLDGLGGDTRAPVLFLRSFADDGRISSGARLKKWDILVPRRFALSLWSFLCLRWSFEQVLAYATRELGPLVAIGGRDAPPVLGAYNFYMRDDNWRERVRELAAQCQLVVIRAGVTPGLMDEVADLTSFIDPQKLLVFFPNGNTQWWSPIWRLGSRRKIYARFREMTAKQFPVALPERLNGATSMGFGADWTPFPIGSSGRPPAVAASREYVGYMLGAIT